MNLRPLPIKTEEAGNRARPTRAGNDVAYSTASPTNPWMAQRRRSRLGSPVVYDSATRLEIVKEADAERLRAFITWPGTQPTVRAAAEHRLRKLEKGKNAR